MIKFEEVYSEEKISKQVWVFQCSKITVLICLHMFIQEKVKKWNATIIIVQYLLQNQIGIGYFFIKRLINLMNLNTIKIKCVFWKNTVRIKKINLYKYNRDYLNRSSNSKYNNKYSNLEYNF